MKKRPEIDRAKSLLDKFFSISPVKCLHFAGDRACVTCDRKDSCTSVDARIRDFGNIRLTVIGNSAMLSILLPLKSDIEEIMLAKLASSLEQEPELPIIKPEMGFDLTFYTKYGQVISKEQQFLAITKILEFLAENPWIQAKMLINKWIKDTIDKLNLKIRREFPKISLKKAPKIERSKIFEPKHKVLTEEFSQIDDAEMIEEKPPSLIESSQAISEELIKRSKIPKQPFFLTAKEREKEYAMWPSNIKRREFVKNKPITIEIPSVSEATKRIGPEIPTIDESHIPKGDQFQLRIHKKKHAEVKPLPPMPTDDSFKILIYLENLVKNDYEMRKMADAFEQGKEIIQKTMFYTDFLTEMDKVINTLRKAEPGLTLSELNRKDILNKISKWKSSPRWKSSLRRKKTEST